MPFYLQHLQQEYAKCLRVAGYDKIGHASQKPT